MNHNLQEQYDNVELKILRALHLSFRYHNIEHILLQFKNSSDEKKEKIPELLPVLINRKFIKYSKRKNKFKITNKGIEQYYLLKKYNEKKISDIQVVQMKKEITQFLKKKGVPIELNLLVEQLNQDWDSVIDVLEDLHNDNITEQIILIQLKSKRG